VRIQTTVFRAEMAAVRRTPSSVSERIDAPIFRAELEEGGNVFLENSGPVFHATRRYKP
jgi:hypothetical protein